MGKKGFAFLLILFFQNYSMAAGFETLKRADEPRHVIFYCMKNGVKITTDQPCYKHDAPEQSRRFVHNPEKDDEFLKIRDARERTFRVQNSKPRESGEKLAVDVRENADQDARRKQERCDLLHKEKEAIKAYQRQHSYDYLTERHREIDAEIYNQKCGFR